MRFSTSTTLFLSIVLSTALSHPHTSYITTLQTVPETVLSSDSTPSDNENKILKSRQATYEFRQFLNLWGNGRWCFWWCKDKTSEHYVPLNGERSRRDARKFTSSSSLDVHVSDVREDRFAASMAAEEIQDGIEQREKAEGNIFHDDHNGPLVIRFSSGRTPAEAIDETNLPPSITSPLAPLDTTLSLLHASSATVPFEQVVEVKSVTEEEIHIIPVTLHTHATLDGRGSGTATTTTGTVSSTTSPSSIIVPANSTSLSNSAAGGSFGVGRVLGLTVGSLVVFAVICGF